jgi:hypothetical protein
MRERFPKPPNCWLWEASWRTPVPLRTLQQSVYQEEYEELNG